MGLSVTSWLNCVLSAAGAPLGSIFGNLLAGFISQYVNWKWVFGVIAIMAGLVAVVGILVIPPPRPKVLRTGDQCAATKVTVDWIGGFLITIGLLVLMFALTEGNVVGWRTWWIWLLVVFSLVIIAAFIVWQWYLENKTDRRPLMKVSMFYNKRFSAAMVIMALFFSSFNNFLVYATYFFQQYQGASSLQTTFYFLPTGGMGVFTAIIVAQLVSRVPTYLLLLFGNFCVSISNLLFAVPIPPHSSYFAYGFIAMILSVWGADTTWPSLTLFTSKALPHEDQALGGALVNAVGQIGRAIGLAFATAIQTAVMAQRRGLPVEEAGGIIEWDEPSLDGMRAANWLGFGLGICAFLVVAFFFRSSEIVGKVDDPGPARSGGIEGVMNEEETDEELRIGVNR
jgi:predicted MFS family arabinose efflux permease